MKYKRVCAVYFSPTGSTGKITQKIAMNIARKLGLEVVRIDYTLPKKRRATYSFDQTDIVIFGSPVYAGRLPNKLLPFVKNNFKGHQALAIPIVTFGNRSYDDALMELNRELMANGFKVIAGAGIVTEHVFSSVLATGRPDEKDWEEILSFSNNVTNKIRVSGVCDNDFYVKGNNPPNGYYTPLGRDGKPTVFLKAKPKTDSNKCQSCGLCAELCPMASINKLDPSKVEGVCIKCHACINLCPSGAKFFDHEALLSHIEALEKTYSRRVESDFFL